jgi:hypothetical protein
LLLRIDDIVSGAKKASSLTDRPAQTKEKEEDAAPTKEE